MRANIKKLVYESAEICMNHYNIDTEKIGMSVKLKFLCKDLIELHKPSDCSLAAIYWQHYKTLATGGNNLLKRNRDWNDGQNFKAM